MILSNPGCRLLSPKVMTGWSQLPRKGNLTPGAQKMPSGPQSTNTQRFETRYSMISRNHLKLTMILSDFAPFQAASTHGTSYVFDRGLPHLERLVWAGVCVAFYCLATYWIIDSYNAWQNNPVITTIQTTGEESRKNARVKQGRVLFIHMLVLSVELSKFKYFSTRNIQV